MVTFSTRAYATHRLTQVCCTQSPCPYSRPLLTCISAGDSCTGLAQSLWGLWVLVHTRFCLSPPSVWWLWGLVPNAILHLLPSYWDFSFALGHGVSFGVIQFSPVDGYSATSCNFGVLTEEDEHMSFYSSTESQTPRGVGLPIP